MPLACWAQNTLIHYPRRHEVLHTYSKETCPPSPTFNFSCMRNVMCLKARVSLGRKSRRRHNGKTELHKTPILYDNHAKYTGFY